VPRRAGGFRGRSGEDSARRMISGRRRESYVGTLGEEEAGDDFFGNSGAAEARPAAFKDNHFFPRLWPGRGGIDEAIMAASDDDD